MRIVNEAAARGWYGNSGTPPAPLEVLVGVVEELLEMLEEEEVVTEAEVELEEVEADVVEEVVDDGDSSASGTTATEEPPLMAANTSPFPES